MIIIDFGPHRTGTTSRQYYFKNHPQVNLICKFDLRKQLSNTKTNIISDESLAQSLDTFIYPIAIDRVSKMFPNATALFVDRDIKSWKISMYKHYSMKGGKLSFQEWIDKCKPNFNTFKNKLNEYFKEVIVLDFEDFKENPVMFLKRLSKILDIDYIQMEIPNLNKSMNKRKINFLKLYNNYFPFQNVPRELLKRI